jgi:hypothetical protein
LDGTALSAETAFGLGTRARPPGQAQAGVIAAGAAGRTWWRDHLGHSRCSRADLPELVRDVAPAVTDVARPPGRRAGATDDDRRGRQARWLRHEGLDDLSTLVLDGGPLRPRRRRGRARRGAARSRQIPPPPRSWRPAACSSIGRRRRRPIYGTTGVGKLKDV